VLVPATRLGRTALLAAAARAEALLRAEQGELDAAVDAATRALQYYDQIERPLERARTLLAKGQIHRRFRQRALARDELAGAQAAFEALGARGFAARAGIELARIGSRLPASGELSETERRIAEHAARGMRSAEIGRTMFLSTKTVSANLTRIYQKLGVRNRAELAARLETHRGVGSRS
jgi:DNA-binding CsgD family transcriptional regulator